MWKSPEIQLKNIFLFSQRPSAAAVTKGGKTHSQIIQSFICSDLNPIACQLLPTITCHQYNQLKPSHRILNAADCEFPASTFVGKRFWKWMCFTVSFSLSSTGRSGKKPLEVSQHVSVTQEINGLMDHIQTHSTSPREVGKRTTKSLWVYLYPFCTTLFVLQVLACQKGRFFPRSKEGRKQTLARNKHFWQWDNQEPSAVYFKWGIDAVIPVGGSDSDGIVGAVNSLGSFYRKLIGFNL